MATMDMPILYIQLYTGYDSWNKLLLNLILVVRSYSNNVVTVIKNRINKDQVLRAVN